jgi:hypothetical protein
MRGKLDKWQKRALAYTSSRDREKRLCLSASAGVGKTAVMAWLGWLRLLCYGRAGGHPQGIAIAVDGKNLKANLRKEMVLWYKQNALLQQLFEVTSDRIRSREHPDTWFLEFRSFPRSATEDEKGASLSGLHSPYPFILLDESALIPPLVGMRAEQAFSIMEDGLVVQAGNPMSRKGSLYHASKTRSHLWHTIHITSDPDDPERCERIDPEWARAQIDAAPMGRDDPWIRVFVLGLWPESEINTLLSEEDVAEAMARAPKKEDFDWAPKVLGVDVAQEGLDESVIARRQGPVLFPLTALRGMNSTNGATRVARIWADWDADACFIDAGGGFGGAWRDRLVGYGYDAVQVPFAGRPPDQRFHNMRSYMGWQFSQWVKEGGALPADDKLAEECVEITYTHIGDKMLLEPKAEIKKRLNRSTDRWDACGLTFAAPIAPRPNPYDPVQALRRPVHRAKTGLQGKRPR